MKIRGVKKICTLSKNLKGTKKMLHIVYHVKLQEVTGYSELSENYIQQIKDNQRLPYIYIGIVDKYVSMDTVKNMVCGKIREINLKSKK